MIYGIEKEVNGESPPKPNATIPPIGVSNPDVETIERIVSNGIYPRVNIEINPIRIEDNSRFILIIGIAASYNAPHMVISNHDFRYYKRGNYQSEIMNESDVRDLYTRSENMLEKLNDLLTKKRALIYELNASLRNQVTYSFIISPMILQNELISFDSRIINHIHSAYTRDIVQCPSLKPSLCGYYADNTYNHVNPDSQDIIKFVEVCRNGLIQSSGKISTLDNILNANNIKNDIIKLVKISKEMYENNKYYGSVLFNLNINGVNNFTLQYNRHNGNSNRFRRGEISIEIVKNTNEIDIRQTVDELLNRIFNAFGIETHSLNLEI